MKKPFLHLVLLLLALNFFQNQDANAQAGMWTWVSGDSVVGSTGVFGIQGTPSVNNHPPGVYEPCEWKDKQGNFWIYGGCDPAYSDMWKFNPQTLEWTWIKGNGLTNQSASYGIKGTPNSLNTPGSRKYASATWVDTSGCFWLFGGNYPYNNDLWKYDISNNVWTWMSGSQLTNQSGVYGTQGIPSNLNIPGARSETTATWTDSLNNLWLFGGEGRDGYGSKGTLNDLWKYNIALNEWTWMKGSKSINFIANYGVKGVSNSNNDPGARMTYAKWKDIQGNFWIFGGVMNFGILRNDLWKFEISNNAWTWISGTNSSNNSGNYQSNCVFDTINLPSSRFENKSSVTDICGRFWMFGGSHSPAQMTNDLWVFDPQQLKWNWLSGNNFSNQPGSYGVKGVSAATNMPPSRYGAAAWWGNNNRFYLFGGNQNNIGPNYSDVWVYTPDSNCIPCNALQPTINLHSSDTTFCEKNCINFFDLSTNNPTSWQWYFPGASPDTSTLQNPTNICYNTYGNYDVTLIACNANGCDSLHLTNFITCFQNPVDSIYQSNDTLYSLPAYSYQWYETTSGIIAGATNQYYVLSQPGSYFCVVTDSVGCESTSNVVVITAVPPLSFGEGPGVRLHPNPNDGTFEIVWINEQVIKNAEIGIFNAVGQVVFQLQLNTDHSLLTTHHSQIKTNLPNGIYSVSLTTNNGIFTKRIEVLK